MVYPAQAQQRGTYTSSQSFKADGESRAPPPKVQDVYIGVMGATGAGKSTLIATCTQKRVKIGHGLQSCTVDVEDIWFMFTSTIRVHLIDTPGFDDTNKSDVQVLQDVAHWLSKSFENGVRLSGLIYLHRISDPRMAGSARRTLMMFKKLCGEKAFQSVVLATTMWSKVTEEEGSRREKELIETPEFWGLMYQRGSKIFRYHNTREYGLELVKYILSQHMTVTLDIQDEIVNHGRDIDETSAAHELNAEIIRERKKHREELEGLRSQMQQAMEEHDEGLQKIFQEEIGELQKMIDKGDEEQQKLRQTLEEVNKRKEEEFKAFKAQMKKEREEEQARYAKEREQSEKAWRERERVMNEQFNQQVQHMEEERAGREEMRRKQEEYRAEVERERKRQEKRMNDIEARHKAAQEEWEETERRRKNRSFFDRVGDFIGDLFS